MKDIMLISGGTLIDGTGADPRPNEGIAIAGNQIVAIGNEAANVLNDLKSEELKELDATGKTIMPVPIDPTFIAHLMMQSNDELFFTGSNTSSTCCCSESKKNA